MNDGMKRLMGYEGIRTIQGIGEMVLVGAGGILWFLLLYGKVINLMFAVTALVCLLLLSYSVRDWQFNISTYISMSITRKSTFAVIVIRGVLQAASGLLLEIIIGGIGYPKYVKREVILGSLFLFLLFHGWGLVCGALTCTHKKTGKVMQVISLMIIGGMIGGGSVAALDEHNMLTSMVNLITIEGVLCFGIAALLIWILGICAAYKQSKNFMVS